MLRLTPFRTTTCMTAKGSRGALTAGVNQSCLAPLVHQGYASCRGRSSRMSYQGAFEPTNICAIGLSEGSSTSVPYGIRTYACSGAVLVQYTRVQQTEQRISWSAPSSPRRVSVSAPLVTRSFSASISPHGRNADPVAVRQFEQWQMYATRNSSATSYSTAPQPHRP